jgi:hypothetical protein
MDLNSFAVDFLEVSIRLWTYYLSFGLAATIVLFAHVYKLVELLNILH